MYPAQPNGAEGATINPAALSSSDLNRGMKRSRSPEYPIQTGTIADDEKPRKRGRPMKNRPSGSLDDSQHGLAPMQTPVPLPQVMPPQTPQSQTMPLPLQSPQQFAPPTATPSHASPPPPPKPTPKSTLKALPTVRDHTTDQLVPGGDEYIPRETDEAGEKKVMPNGQLTGGREYKCRTFLVPNRGDKLFMLATECARVLGYRDSYLLFNKNRSLYKIIASQVEKDDLVNQDVLPFSYRSRQIAIVTARSMFRQFGSRVIMNGRRVRDDYWEGKARKQGFTEADLAGEKRPGGGKVREAQEAAQAAQNAALMGPPQGEIVYSNTGHYGGAPQAPLIQPGPEYTDTRSRDYTSNVLKAPRQEITGPPYQDRIQPSAIPELHAQAHHAADFNRGINQQREMRTNYMQDVYRRPHEQPPSLTNVMSQSVGSSDTSLPPTSRASHQSNATSGLQQPHQTASTQSNQGSLASQSPQLMMTAAPYSQPLTSQSQIQPRLGSSGGLPSGGQGYNYQQSNSSWPQTPQTPQYSYSHPGQTQQSPHQQQSQQTSSSQQQLRQQPSNQQSSTMPYSGMPGMAQGYTTGTMNHGLPYDQTPRQYMHQTPAAAPAVTQSWSSQPQASWQGWAGQPQ
uniref:Chromatin structure-remodeling complex protein RSC7 n=1 Tax=Pyricularia oryzae (strain P131) TaxID=1143193 RepID=L7JLY4_PYRO1